MRRNFCDLRLEKVWWHLEMIIHIWEYFQKLVRNRPLCRNTAHCKPQLSASCPVHAASLCHKNSAERVLCFVISAFWIFLRARVLPYWLSIQRIQDDFLEYLHWLLFSWEQNVHPVSCPTRLCTILSFFLSVHTYYSVVCFNGSSSLFSLPCAFLYI